MIFKIIRTPTIISVDLVLELADVKPLQTAFAFHIYICRDNQWLCNLKPLFAFFSHLANSLLNWIDTVASVYPIVCIFLFRISSNLWHHLITSLCMNNNLTVSCQLCTKSYTSCGLLPLHSYMPSIAHSIPIQGIIINNKILHLLDQKTINGFTA